MEIEMEQQLKLQKSFSRINGYLFTLLLIYILERFAHNAKSSSLQSLYIIIPILAVDLLLNYRDYFRNLFVLKLLRYMEVSAAAFFVSICSYRYNMGISALFLSFAIIEFLSLFELLETYYRTIALMLVALPVILFTILNSIFLNMGGDQLFSTTFYSGLYIAGISYLTLLFSRIRHTYDEKVFAQSRLISNANALNEDLRSNQEKVKKANELLGIQKIKLEAAYYKINNANAEMTIQNEIVKYISSSLEIGKLMTLITESMLNQIGVDICAIVLNPGVVENKKVKYKIRTTLSSQFNQEFSNAIEAGCFKEYLSSKKIYVDNHADETIYPFLKINTIGSLLIIPLVREERQIGILLAGHPQYDYFVDNTLFFEAIVSQFLIALNNANMYLKMENMAIRDGLTGIFNRGHLTDLFNEYLNEAILNRTPLTVALFDIDKFKNVNDTYGHLFGDVVIKTIACLANDTASSNSGIVGRYGGEEFVIVFPNKSLEDSYSLVSALHQKIKTTELFHNGESVFINVSVGITSYPETCKNPSELLNRADWAMYYSKQNGRDRITIDSDTIREEVLLK